LRQAAATQPELASSDLPTFAATVMVTRSRWRWSTRRNALGGLLSALARLPQYCPGLHPIDLSAAPSYQDALRVATHRANQEPARTPMAATTAEVEATIARLQASGDHQLAVALILAWAHAARLGCVFQLHRHDLLFSPDYLRIVWRRGKGVKARGPYTTWSLVGHHAAYLQEHLPPTGPLFPGGHTDKARSRMVSAMLRALRATAPHLECRSLRRGSLQALAAMKLTDEVLMTFSGHTCVRTLYRYLGWGAEHAQHREAALAAATTLWSSAPSGTTTTAAQALPTSG
jgi:integrase